MISRSSKSEIIVLTCTSAFEGVTGSKRLIRVDLKEENNGNSDYRQL